MSVSRRHLLRCTTATALSLAVWPRSVFASDRSLEERVDLLFSNRFHFDEQGRPHVTVGLLHHQTKVTLAAAGGLRLFPSDPDGTVIEGGTPFEIRLGRSQPAEQRYTVVLDQSDAAGIAAVRKRWSNRGLETEEIEVGTVFGVHGQVLDNRTTRITSGRFTSRKDAEKQAERWRKRWNALGTIHPLVPRRGTGRMTATDLEHHYDVRAEGILWFAPRGRAPITVHPNQSEHRSRSYAGLIGVAIDKRGRLTVINLISETDVLSGLVPAEIYPHAPLAALKAQAVAARGQLVSKVGTRHLDDPFLLCAQEHCQVYAGKDHEHPRTTAAVQATAGWVAMRPHGRGLVDTVYSANSGGYTEHNELVWPGPADPQLRARPDPLLPSRFTAGIGPHNIEPWIHDAPRCHSRPKADALQTAYRWSATLDRRRIATQLARPELGPVQRIEVLQRGVSGRAIHIRLHGRISLDLRGELVIRRALGNLRSSMFVVTDQTATHFELRGGGHGHGVGLCQHGAMGMARAGHDHHTILRHYYTGAELTQLW